MKKEDITAFIVYLLILAAAIIFGISVLQQRASSSDLSQGGYIFYIIGAIVCAILFNSILFELAHIAGAKLGKYIVVSVNILGLCFYKQNEKRKVKFSPFDGLTGETRIRPNLESKKEPNPRHYLLFGTLFYCIELVLVIVLYIVMNGISTSLETKVSAYLDIAYFFIIIAFIGGMMLIYNVIPFHLDSITDGYRLTLVSNPKNKIAFNELLRVQYEIESGNKEVEVKTFDQITNFTADLNLNKVYTLLDNDRFSDALPLLEQIVNAKEGISERVYIRALAQIVYIKMMTLSLKEAVEYIEKDISVSCRRLITSDSSMVCIRSNILIEGLINESKSECLLTFNKLQVAYKRTSNARKPIEVKLFNAALKKVVEAHPKWEFENYYLEVVDNKK